MKKYRKVSKRVHNQGSVALAKEWTNKWGRQKENPEIDLH